MSTASSLLLLILVVNVQLCSPASIQPGPEGFELAEVAGTLQEGSAEEVAPSPEGSPPEKDFMNPEVPGLTGELVSAGPDDAVSLPPEFLMAAPHEYVIDDDGFGVSPEDAELDVEGESSDQRHVEEPGQIAPIIPLEDSEDGAIEERPEDEAAPRQTLVIVPDAPQGPRPETPEEEKSDVLVPVETQVEAYRDKTDMEETAPEEPADHEEQEQTINTDSSNTREQEAFASVLAENKAEDSVVVSPEQPEDQVDPAAEDSTVQGSWSQGPAVSVSVDSAEEALKWGDQEEAEAPEDNTQPEPHPTFVLADVKTNEEDREKTATQESAPESEITTEKPTPEDLILIVPLEGPDDHTEEGVLSDFLPWETALEEHNEPDGSDPDMLSVSATEATTQTSATVWGPAENVPLATTELLTGPSTESLTPPAPASTDADVESVPASVTGVSATDAELNAAGVLTGGETGAQANGGAVLGAAFFTLLCFIIIGFVGVIVSKKLRQLHDTEAKVI